MRILIIRNAYQKDTGGAEQYSFNLGLALKNAGHYPIVVTKHQSIHDKCREHGIRSVQGIWHESQEWGRHYYIRRILMPVWYIYLIIRHRINVVSPQSRDDFIFATSAARILGKPSVWTDHADLKYIMDRVNHRHPRMQKWMLHAASHAKKIVCVSNSEHSSILDVAPELKDKLTIVHNGVFRPSNVAPVKKTGVVIGTNARLVPSKGIEELMRAFAGISKKHKPVALWIVGGLSENKDKYTQLADKLSIKEQVTLLGYVPNPNNYVASMDIFVHASYHEAFSLAIIEACMLGRPIIATDTGGTPEIINKDTGILVRPKNTDDIEKALTKLLENPKLREKLGKNAQARAEKDFDFQTIVEDRLIPIYEETL